ncbi:retroviral-like aspartic protease family protein [Anabaena sphaerica FACHB-251]|uniref:Retroviral-like aspartic protease family protein n=1 Tax=Anabaena sphaerica FACHB-251 TaxID=2692883 RepID=A0A926WHG6_9NOST|nr:retropepsin-like aspartic protease [Anabaena sphaerica]MBD2294558.1 retroviral-like aspartic protease family protein [Anabaena sphaerica FACHB-251]
MNAIKKIGITAISGMMLLTLPSVATANDPGGCFMVTSSGKTVSLGQLCGMTPPPSTPKVFRIPIKRRIGKTPIIDVTFNGNQVFEMVVDTGATGILITQEVATALKLQPSGTMKASIADGSIVEFKTSNVLTVSVGGAVLNNAKVAIAPKARIGLLGHDFFEKYDLKILEKQVEFYPR